jgi:hypothetical protein
MRIAALWRRHEEGLDVPSGMRFGVQKDILDVVEWNRSNLRIDAQSCYNA